MRKKADLADALAEISGSTRRKPEPEVPQAPQAPQAKQQPSRKGTKPITLHFPELVRKQFKIMAAELDTTMHDLAAEAFNDLFAKHGKPEICPFEKKKSAQE
jgi:hypothetical protein